MKFLEINYTFLNLFYRHTPLIHTNFLLQNFKMELDRKWHGYYEISSQSSFLYEIMQQVFHLEPYYEPSLQNFEEQFKMTLENCKRHKARSGSTSSLVNEITATFSLDLYKRICINIFKGECIFNDLLNSNN